MADLHPPEPFPLDPLTGERYELDAVNRVLTHFRTDEGRVRQFNCCIATLRATKDSKEHVELRRSLLGQLIGFHICSRQTGLVLPSFDLRELFPLHDPTAPQQAQEKEQKDAN